MPSSVVALMLAYAGMAALCLSMNRHCRQVMDRMPARRVQIALRAAGWLMLVLLFVFCVNVWSWSIGIVAAFGILTAATLLLVFILPYAPRLAMSAGAVVLVPSLAGILPVLIG